MLGEVFWAYKRSAVHPKGVRREAKRTTNQSRIRIVLFLFALGECNIKKFFGAFLGCTLRVQKGIFLILILDPRCAPLALHEDDSVLFIYWANCLAALEKNKKA